MALRERQKAIRRAAARKALGPSARLRNLRMTARKVRLVVDLIRNQPVEQALRVLHFCPKAAASPLQKLLRSALANADQRGFSQLESLYVKTAVVDEGPTWRRFLPRAMGRSSRIRKRTSHVTLILAER